jgi:hypothetical protein
VRIWDRPGSAEQRGGAHRVRDKRIYAGASCANTALRRSSTQQRNILP